MDSWSALDGNDPSDFKADITEFLLRFSGYEDLENVSFFIYSRREGKVYTRRTGLRQDLRRYIKLENSRVCAPPAGVKLAKPKRISSDLHNPTKYQDTIKINIYSDASSIRTRFSNKLEAKKKQIF